MSHAKLFLIVLKGAIGQNVPMRLALYQPEIPENTAALMRLAACLAAELHLIEPLGFALNTKKMRRIGMDYAALVTIERHVSFDAFLQTLPESGRLVLATTKAHKPYWSHTWGPNDILLLGQESAGVPQSVHDRAQVRLTIPMANSARSLNLASAATLICSDWYRQKALP